MVTRRKRDDRSPGFGLFHSGNRVVCPPKFEGSDPLKILTLKKNSRGGFGIDILRGQNRRVICDILQNILSLKDIGIDPLVSIPLGLHQLLEFSPNFFVYEGEECALCADWFNSSGANVFRRKI